MNTIRRPQGDDFGRAIYDASSAPLTWDKAAESYDVQRAEDPIYKSCIDQAIFECLKNAGKNLALDAGCGTGMTTIPLSYHFATVVALDFSFESLKILRNKVSNPSILLVQADIRHLPFRDNTFEAVLCANTLQHLQPDPSQHMAASELLQVLKTNASAVVTVHHYNRKKREARWVKEGKPGQAGIDYIFRFSIAELVSLFPSARIKAVGFYGLGRIPWLGIFLQKFIARFFGRIAARWEFGHMLLGVIKKVHK